MSPSVNAILGIAFLVVGLLATILMYHLWGYPYDKEKLQSSAPRGLVNLHRLLGYTYVGIYIVLMWQMIPRMWEYQIELPARTVVHLTLGMTIGAILILKIAIVQFFRHMEATLIPFLGTALMICTVLVISLSVPFALRENYLSASADSDSLDRVNTLLIDAGQTDQAFRSELASIRGLEAGRNVLYNQCTGCHDLRTVLAKPRTPKNWWSTVKRMADRTDLLDPITELQQWQVTAYLIAISPDLQKSVLQKRKEAELSNQSKQAIENLSNTKNDNSNGDRGDSTKSNADNKNNPGETDLSPDETGGGQGNDKNDGSGNSDAEPLVAPKNYSANVAKFLYENKCSQCHKLDTVTNFDFAARQDVTEILERMVDEGLEASEKELGFLQHYLTESFVK